MSSNIVYKEIKIRGLYFWQAVLEGVIIAQACSEAGARSQVLYLLNKAIRS